MSSLKNPESHKVADRILRRAYLLFAGFLLFAIALVGQIVHVMFVDGERWRTAQVEEKVYFKQVQASRGAILSDDGSVLAITLPFYRIALDVTMQHPESFPSYADSLDALCKGLASQFGREGYTRQYFKSRILKARQQGDRHVYLFPVKRTFNFREMKAITALPILNQGRFKGGLIVEKVNNRRFYPFKDVARITLGFVADDSTGFKGVEFSYNDYLRGQDGTMLVQRIPGGVEVPLSEYGGKESQDGYDVVTTLDVHMQDVVQNALRKAITRHNAKGGVAILMEVGTGHIKAIANYPETYNHAVATLYEPGSTFKLASVMAGMEDGYLHENDSVDTGAGEYKFFDRTMRDAHGYGRLSLRQCFEKSSNVGIAKLVYQHYKNRPEQFISRLDQLGVLGGTGFELRGEPAPYIIRPGDKEWSGPTLPWLSTGYSVRLTPLQVLSFYNAVANNGKMMRPMIVQALRSGSDEVERFEPTVLRKKIASDETLAMARGFMEGVVDRGTAKAIRTDAYPAAGKTGTAQKLINGEYKRTYRASFAGYFPAESPRYSCFIMIEEPTEDGYYGGDVAAPVFREIADALYATDITLSKPASELQAASKPLHYPVTRVVHQGDAKTVYDRISVSAPADPETEFVRSWQNGQVVRLAPQKLSKVSVPDVIGMSAKDAMAVLENLGLQVRLQGHGKVRRQNIRAGSAFRKGQTITLTLTS